jgi:hypothetical protein
MTRLLFALALALPSLAYANAPDEFAFSARAAGMAGAVVSTTTGYAAAHHNPGGAALSPDFEAAVGYGGGVMALSIDGRDADITPPRGVSIGLNLPVKLRSWRFALAVALYLPDQFVARIRLRPSTEPHFALLDNNLHHVVVTPVLSVSPTSWLSLGAGASVLADAAGNGITFDVGITGGEKVGKAALDVALPVRAAAVAGITIIPTRWLRLGAAYRGQLDLSLKLDVLANVDIAGVITGDTFITIRALNFFTPQKASMGLSIDPHRKLTLSAEVDWLNWSAYTGALPDLRVLVGLDISPPIVEGVLPRTRFDDIWVPRFGAEFRHDVHAKVGLSLRVGYAWSPSPVPDQTLLTSFADNHRHVVALGAGIELRELVRVLEKPLRLDFAFQLHALEGRRTTKDPRYFPGQQFSSGGVIAHFSVTLEGRF